MNKRPWFKCYPSDFLNGVSSLSPNELAVYTVCLMRMYDEGGAIPDDPERIARRCNMRPSLCRKILGELTRLEIITRREDKLWVPSIDVWKELDRRQAIPIDIKNLVFDRDGQHCRYCGDEDGPFHLDHVIPLSAGGTDDWDNLVVACQGCNLSKGAKLLEEWLQ